MFSPIKSNALHTRKRCFTENDCRKRKCQSLLYDANYGLEQANYELEQANYGFEECNYKDKKSTEPSRLRALLKTISNKHYGLHTFGNFDAQQAHAQTDYLAHLARQGETEHLDIGILLAQDAEVVVELVVLLHQVVAVIGNA